MSGHRGRAAQRQDATFLRGRGRWTKDRRSTPQIRDIPTRNSSREWSFDADTSLDYLGRGEWAFPFDWLWIKLPERTNFDENYGDEENGDESHGDEGYGEYYTEGAKWASRMQNIRERRVWAEIGKVLISPSDMNYPSDIRHPTSATKKTRWISTTIYVPLTPSPDDCFRISRINSRYLIRTAQV